MFLSDFLRVFLPSPLEFPEELSATSLLSSPSFVTGRNTVTLVYLHLHDFELILLGSFMVANLLRASAR